MVNGVVLIILRFLNHSNARFNIAFGQHFIGHSHFKTLKTKLYLQSDETPPLHYPQTLWLSEPVYLRTQTQEKTAWGIV